MTLTTEIEAANTRETLRELEERYKARRRETAADERVHELTLQSLKRLINQLKEELARYDAGRGRAETAPLGSDLVSFHKLSKASKLFGGFLAEPGRMEEVFDGLGKFFLPLTYATSDHQSGVCSGFLLHHRDIDWWVTAGHVVKDELRPAMAHFGPEGLRAGWVDISGAAQRISVDIPSLLNRTLTPPMKYGADLSVTALSPNERRLLSRGPKSALIGSSVIRKRGWRLMGYMIVGAPKEGVSSTLRRTSPAELTLDLSFGGTFVPIAKVRRADENGEFWGYPGAFYGRVIEFPHLTGVAHSIAGMSGGPVFAIEYLDDNYQARLVAVQSSQVLSKRLIRATPIRWVLMFIDAAVNVARKKGADLRTLGFL